jgi:hypothetical protein
MATIPLQKYCDIEFPLTPKSTRHLWAEMGFYRNEGPLAGKIRRIGGRWYVEMASDDVVVEGILNHVRAVIEGEQNAI